MKILTMVTVHTAARTDSNVLKNVSCYCTVYIPPRKEQASQQVPNIAETLKPRKCDCEFGSVGRTRRSGHALYHVGLEKVDVCLDGDSLDSTCLDSTLDSIRSMKKNDMDVTK